MKSAISCYGVIHVAFTSELVSSAISANRGPTVKGWGVTGRQDHLVQFYRTDEYLIECLASYVAKGIWAEECVIVMATAEHRIALEERLRLKSVDVASNTASGRYLALDAREILEKFMRDGRPDLIAFRRVVAELLRRPTEGQRPVRAFGEMVALLWANDEREAALELEQLWNDLAKDYTFSLLCAYPADCVTPKEGRPGIEHICQNYSSVIPFLGS